MSGFCYLINDGIPNLSAAGFQWAGGIAVGLSLVFALIEIPTKAKSELRACLVGESIFYWLVLSFGNVVTTLLASQAVIKLPFAALAPYFPVLTAFFGVFGFEIVLKNTNITIYDKGVLTIQNWIDKAANVAVAAAIRKQEDISQQEEEVLVANLMKLPEIEINTRVLNKMGANAVRELETAAKASSASGKRYKVFQLVSKLNRSERVAVLHNRPPRRFGFSVTFIVFVVVILATGTFAAFRYLVTVRQQSIVLQGSGNVYPFLQERFPALSEMNFQWLDTGSTSALLQSFAQFDYGRSVASQTRSGFAVMSSNGTAALESQFNKGPESFKENNYWLSISVAHPPLAVLYRGNAETDLNVKPVSAEPVGYRSVLFADLRNFIESEPTAPTKRYFPEGGTGTRSRLDEENKSPIKWPSTEQVPDYIEELNGQFPFAEIVSYPQLSKDTKKAASCDQLRQMKIGSAVICPNSAKCDHFILADYVLVIKVVPNFGAGSNEYLITNPAECKIAQALDSDEIKDCKVFGNPQNHILRVNAPRSGPADSLSYLKCSVP